MFSMTSDGFSQREVADIAETIRDELLHIEGVGKVELLGDQEERVFVEYSNAQLAQLGLSPVAIQQLLSARNIIMPGGQIDLGPERIALEPSGNFASVEELGRTLIELPTGGLAYLGDVTTIRRGYVDPPIGLVTANGDPAITFAVNMAEHHNLVELGAHVKHFFDALPRRYPHGIDFELTYYQPSEVQAKVDDFAKSVLQAVGIVLIVMLLTLGLRTGLVVSSLIPAAMIITIWILNLLNETINQMSLAALIIALGLLVDNAIVVSESILVRMSKGQSAFDAAVKSCAELRTPLLVSSLTTAAAFLPIYLAESTVGEYTGALFTVVSITLLVSWALAITMTPLLCTLFLKVPKSDGESFEGVWYRGYRRALRGVLRFRWITLAVVLAAFAGSTQLWQLVPNIFFPSQERAFFMAELTLPPGTGIETTRAMSAEVDRFLRGEKKEDGRIDSWTTFIGETPVPFTLGYSPSPSLGGYSESMVHTTSVESAHSLMADLERFVVDHFPDAKAHIRPLSSGPSVAKPVQVRISGTDTDRIFEIADQVKTRLAQVEGTRNIGDDWGPRVKKLVVRIDEERARRAGVSHQEVAVALQTYLSGLETTRYREEDASIPVLVRSISADRRDLNRVRNLAVFSQQRRANVPLSQVADIELQWQPSAVLRRNRYRTVTVEANVAPGTTAIGVMQEIKPWLEAQSDNWDLGYRYELGGELESSGKANASIGAQLPIAMLVIVLLLVGPIQLAAQTHSGALDHCSGPHRSRHWIGHHGELVRIHDLAGRHLAGRHRHQQRHRLTRPDRNRNRRWPTTL